MKLLCFRVLSSAGRGGLQGLRFATDAMRATHSHSARNPENTDRAVMVRAMSLRDREYRHFRAGGNPECAVFQAPWMACSVRGADSPGDDEQLSEWFLMNQKLLRPALAQSIFELHPRVSH